MHHLIARWIHVVLLGLACGLPPAALAQSAEPTAVVYSPEELEQLLAPVALHPDTLLMQVLVAATYPLEVVQAQRFLAANAGLKGEALSKAAAGRGWDSSVVSLLQVPAVLAMMNSRLEWTQQLGDALLAQQAQLLDTVQGLRARALQAGHLKSGPQQRVVQEDKVIVLEAAPSLAVPFYDPLLVYGPWWLPAKQPWMWVPPPSHRPRGATAASSSGMSWGPGVGVRASTWNDFRADWAQRQVMVHTQLGAASGGAIGPWRHDLLHRKGVAYRDDSVRQRVASASGVAAPVAPAASAPAVRAPSRGDDQALQPRPNARPAKGSAAAKPGKQAPLQAAVQPSPLDPGAPREVIQRQAERGRTSRQAVAAVDPSVPPPAPARSSGPLPAQPGFDSPSVAVEALVKAVEGGKQEEIAALLGHGAGRLLDSGDPQQDAKARSNFLAAHAKRHYLEADGENRATLLIGEGSWPLPFQLIQSPEGWRFDTSTGLQQYLDRQTGANELATIEVLQTYATAQREYVQRESQRDALLEYAQRMISSAGRHDGLYWASPSDAAPSPMGSRFAMASVGSQRGSDEAPKPFNGYYFRSLTAQGPAAAGGAYEYIVNGRQIGGHALLAIPARHGVSGVMSFIVNQDGVVYAKNLGRQTPEMAARIARFKPRTGLEARIATLSAATAGRSR